MPWVTAKFEFTLPFKIRMLGENACRPCTFQLREDRVVVHPPARLDERDGKPCRFADWHPADSVDGISIWLADTVLIDVTSEVKAYALTEEDVDNFISIAREFLAKLLQTCRWRTGQAWIHADDWSGSHSVHYFDEAGNQIRDGLAKRTGVIVVNRTPGLPNLDSTVWDTVCQALASEAVPELWEELLLDAVDALPSHPGKAVIDAGAACEVFIKSFCNKLADALGADEDVYKELTAQHRPFPEYFHVVLRYLVKRSLKVDNLDVYKEIDHLYLTVNSVRHAGRCEYKGGKREVIGVGSKEVREMINAARSAIEWASSLQNES
ncbi:hypothetical protein ES703_02365 [subsurface metagenome]